jgi:hypothetical protein
MQLTVPITLYIQIIILSMREGVWCLDNKQMRVFPKITRLACLSCSFTGLVDCEVFPHEIMDCIV